MKRPDAMILKRILGKWEMGDKDSGHIMKRAMEVPLLDFTNKADARDFEWAQSDKFFTSSEGIVDVSEWAFDEFVFVYRRPVTLDEVAKKKSISKYAPQLVDEYFQRDPLSPLRTAHLEFCGKKGIPVIIRENFDNQKTLNATIWTYVNRNVQDPFLMKMNGYPKDVASGLEELRVERGLKNPITDMYYSTQYVIYEGEKTVYRWDGFYGLSGISSNEGSESLFVATDGTEAFWGNAIHGLTQHASWTYGGIVRLMTYLKYGDKHLVEVIPAQPQTKQRTELSKKRPWLNATGPRMLLLDRMPATQRVHKGGTHASPKPHRRRGHWKTLRHPKYRHHPQYQQLIYVKPSFVGPKQVHYEGNIYRVVEPIGSP